MASAAGRTGFVVALHAVAEGRVEAGRSRVVQLVFPAHILKAKTLLQKIPQSRTTRVTLQSVGAEGVKGTVDTVHVLVGRVSARHQSLQKNIAFGTSCWAQLTP
jgi:hypothetical protein